MSKPVQVAFILFSLFIAQAPASQPVDYFGLSPADFAKLPEANQSIDFDHINQRLLSAAILIEVNKHRADQKLRTLAHLDQLDDAALIHTRDMVEKKYLKHEQEGDPKLKDPISRVRSTGLKPALVAENIAITFGIQYDGGKPAYPLRQWGREGISYSDDGPAIPPHTYRTFAASIVQQWWNSPHHRENILLPDARYLGNAALPAKPAPDGNDVDFHRMYCTQEFFTPLR